MWGKRDRATRQKNRDRGGGKDKARNREVKTDIQRDGDKKIQNPSNEDIKIQRFRGIGQGGKDRATQGEVGK